MLFSSYFLSILPPPPLFCLVSPLKNRKQLKRGRCGGGDVRGERERGEIKQMNVAKKELAHLGRGCTSTSVRGRKAGMQSEEEGERNGGGRERSLDERKSQG